MADRPGVAARRLAVDAFVRIDKQRAYANLLVPKLLDRSELTRRDRAFVTELVYGTTRMQRACDYLVDRFTVREPDREARAWLRLGAYQLAFTDVPAHAAVSATVEAAPRKIQGYRQRGVAAGGRSSDRLAERGRASELSRLDHRSARRRSRRRGGDGVARGDERTSAGDTTSRRLHPGPGVAVGGRPRRARSRPVGVRCRGRTWRQGHGDGRGRGRSGRRATGARRASVCSTENSDEARPRQRAAARSPTVGGRRFVRARSTGCCSTRRVLASARCGAGPTPVGASMPATSNTSVMCNDGSSTGWSACVKPGGMFVYSVCTMTRAETVAIDEHLERNASAAGGTGSAEPRRGSRIGRGAMLLPQVADTDGMYILRVARPGVASARARHRRHRSGCEGAHGQRRSGCRHSRRQIGRRARGTSDRGRLRGGRPSSGGRRS